MEEHKVQIPSVELLEAELKRECHRNKRRRAFRRTIIVLLIAAAVGVAAARLLQVLQISGASMADTLDDGDIVISLKDSKYKTGDVIGFYHNDSILVKRVVATSGDWVDMDENGNIYVNGKMLYEPYVSERGPGDCDINFPYQVPEGKCFVMGDRRTTSVDSRNSAIGCVSDDMVVGRILLRVWPPENLGTVH